MSLSHLHRDVNSDNGNNFFRYRAPCGARIELVTVQKALRQKGVVLSLISDLVISDLVTLYRLCTVLYVTKCTMNCTCHFSK